MVKNLENLISKTTTLLFIFFLNGTIFSQNPVPDLSQNTNIYSFKSSLNQVFISSIDGLNIYDGRNMQTFRPSSHNMYGNNIQSNFYEDSLNRVWFCTYEAIHYYDPKNDKIEYFFGHSDKGISIYNDYRIIELEGRSLWFLADKFLFEYDVFENKVLKKWKSYVHAVKDIKRIAFESESLFISVSDKGLQTFSIDHNTGAIIDSFTYSIPLQALWLKDEQSLYVGTLDGRLINFDIESKELLKEAIINNISIASIGRYNDSSIVISAFDKSIIWNINQNITITELMYYNGISGKHLDRVENIYISKDSTFWISDDGTGVYYLNEQKKKFDLWLKWRNREHSVTGIYAIEDGESFLITLRSKGIFVISKNGIVLQENSQIIQGSEGGTIQAGIFLDSINFLFHYQNYFYRYNIRNNEYTRLSYRGKEKLLYGIDFHKLRDNSILFCDNSAILSSLKIESNQIILDTMYSSKEQLDIIVSIESMNDSIFFASLNAEKVLVLKYDKSDSKFIEQDILNISGGVKSVESSESKNHAYLSNVNGLFKINLLDFTFEKIEGPNQVFNQTLYAIEKENDQEYWLSSNQGLYYWNSYTDSLYQFNESDGIQGLEFNTDAHFQNSDGRLFFGGVNGLNVFYPEEINLLDYEVPVFISEYMIDDSVSTDFGPSNFIEKIELPYKRNTLSFKFHSTDYADLSSTRVKFKMTGIDDKFVESSDENGFSRYPNLPAGSYTFNIIGSNADQVWNKSIRKVNIIIHPPYWQTWWFRSLAIIFIIGIISLILRNFYQRKMREKDYLLKEQSLIIEKQKAVEKERNRIASEMHDDLGGGLTTISYLSQRIKGKLIDQKSEKQVEKIIDHAKSLVNNMSEIIWAMNGSFDTLENLVSYLRRYAFELLETHNIELHFQADVEASAMPVSGEVRRNIFLACKEILHNIIKHSEANQVNVDITMNGMSLGIKLSDNGIGFDRKKVVDGNGLNNILKRVQKCRGKLDWTTNNGVHYRIEIPLEKA